LDRAQPPLAISSPQLGALDRRLGHRPLSTRDEPGRLSSAAALSVSISPTTMSSRRSRASVSEEEINELIARLQTLLPSARRRGGSHVRMLASCTSLSKIDDQAHGQ